MSRAPFQILVLPFRRLADGELEYAIFKREPKTGGYWQGIAGGGEDDEKSLEAAKRESFEEAGISVGSKFVKLDSFSTVPVEGVCGFKWGKEVLVLPQHCYGVEVKEKEINLSDEHTEYCWLDFKTAYYMLNWDSNKTALWELDYRLRNGLISN